MILACSHLVLATSNVPRICRFIASAFEVSPYFENDQFCEFVFPSGFRLAFFFPVGKSSKYFRAESPRDALSIGVSVADVDTFYQKLQPLLSAEGASVSGEPKDHPWGEKSFLLIDPDGNRWEITKSPTPTGMLVNL